MASVCRKQGLFSSTVRLFIRSRTLRILSESTNPTGRATMTVSSVFMASSTRRPQRFIARWKHEGAQDRKSVRIGSSQAIPIVMRGTNSDRMRQDSPREASECAYNDENPGESHACRRDSESEGSNVRCATCTRRCLRTWKTHSSQSTRRLRRKVKKLILT